MSLTVKKGLFLFVAAMACFAFGTAVFAATSGAAAGGSGTGIAAVANQVKGNLTAVAQLIIALSYITGMGFGVGAIVKFKAHKDNPTQVTIGTPIALLFVAAALLFAPGVYKAAGTTLFTSGSKGSLSGTVNF